MCIRDSTELYLTAQTEARFEASQRANGWLSQRLDELRQDCLLYTSDAADERSSVDLGGRRIINKKKI